MTPLASASPNRSFSPPPIANHHRSVRSWLVMGTPRKSTPRFRIGTKNNRKRGGEYSVKWIYLPKNLYYGEWWLIMMNREPPTVEKIVGRLQEEDNLPDTVHAKQVKQLEYGGGLKETEIEIWESLPYQFRSEVTSTEVLQEPDFEISVINSPVSEHANSGDIFLQDRNKIVDYNREQNTYKIHQLQSPREQIGHTIST